MIRNHLNILTHLARIDGELQEEELRVIYAIGTRNNVSEDDIKDIIENPQPFKIESISSIDRLNQLFEVVEMMMADNKILENELRFCVKLAKKMELQDVMIEILIKIILKGGFTEIDKENLMEEIKFK